MSAPELTVFQQGQGVVSADQLNTFVQGCDTLSELQQFIGSTGLQVYLRGYSAPGDGGQGTFYWSPNPTGPGNNTTIVVPNGAASGAWVRLSYDIATPPTPPTPVGGTLLLDSVTTMKAYIVPGTVDGVELLGYYTAGDGGAQIVARTTGGGPGRFRSGDGAWWVLAVAMPNARQFGAKGDGIADDTVPLQAGITFVGNDTLIIPDGTYNYSATLSVVSGLHPTIVGQSAGGTILNSTSLTAGGIAFTNPPNAFFSGGGVFNVTLRGSPTPASTFSTGTGVLVEGANDNFSLANLFVAGYRIGIELKGCWNTLNDNITVLDVGGWAVRVGCDVAYPTTGGNTFVNCNWTNSGYSAGGTPIGLQVNQSGGEFFTNVQIASFQTGIVISPAAGQQVADMFFDEVIVDTSSDVGILIFGGSGNVDSLMWTNCWSCFNGNAGLDIQGANVDSVRWVGGRVRENAANGVNILAGAKHVSIQNSEIASNGRGTTPGTFAGIGVDAGVSYFQITGNTIGNFASAFNAQGSSVVVDTGSGNHFVITSNVWVAPGGGQPALSNNATGIDVAVTNNVGP